MHSRGGEVASEIQAELEGPGDPYIASLVLQFWKLSRVGSG